MSWSELYPEQFTAETNFKVQVSLDNKATFLELDEFADRHIINGEECICIVQEVISNDDLTINKSGEYYPIIYGNTKTINIPKSSLSKTPVYGQRLWLDGEIFTVANVADDMGILTIVIEGDSR